MAQRTLVYYGNPMLRQKARKIHRFDASLPQLIQDMFETMRAHDGILYLDRLDRPEDLREVRPDDFAEEEAVVE
jgi:peptide deformylase